MPDDFCVVHGYEHMRTELHWGAIPYCAECDRLAQLAKPGAACRADDLPTPARGREGREAEQGVGISRPGPMTATPDERAKIMDHSNLFHEALTKVHDIAKNGLRNTAAWLEVLEIVDDAMEEARRLDQSNANTRSPLLMSVEG